MLISKGDFQSTLIPTSNLISNAQSREDFSIGNANMHTVQTLYNNVKPQIGGSRQPKIIIIELVVAFELCAAEPVPLLPIEPLSVSRHRIITENNFPTCG